MKINAKTYEGKMRHLISATEIVINWSKIFLEEKVSKHINIINTNVSEYNYCYNCFKKKRVLFNWMRCKRKDFIGKPVLEVVEHVNWFKFKNKSIIGERLLEQ